MPLFCLLVFVVFIFLFFVFLGCSKFFSPKYFYSRYCRVHCSIVHSGEKAGHCMVSSIAIFIRISDVLNLLFSGVFFVVLEEINQMHILISLVPCWKIFIFAIYCICGFSKFPSTCCAHSRYHNE